MTWRIIDRGSGSEEKLQSFIAAHGSGDGHLSLALTRDPDFFSALAIEGPRTDALIAVKGEDIVGCAVRAERPCHLNGSQAPIDIGYLGGLRLAPSAQNGVHLGSGFRFLKKIHQASSASFYLTTVLVGNRRAQAVLTSGRAGLPRYDYLGRYRTYLLPKSLFSERPVLKGRYPKGDPEHHAHRFEGEVCFACASDLAGLRAFLGLHGRRRNFFPAMPDNACELPLAGLEVERVLIARDGRGICGVLALWDQRRYRQWRISVQSRRGAVVRAATSIAAQAFGIDLCAEKPLPLVFAALVCVQEDRRSAFDALLRRARREIPRGSLLALGLHERDPLLTSLRGSAKLTLESLLYSVHWPDLSSAPDIDRSYVPYLEPGAL